MFNSNDYDGKEDYRREREKRLAEMDSLNKKAQNDFNDSFFNREANFEMERNEGFEAPKEEKMEKETYHEITKVETEYDYYDDEEDGVKNAIISLLAVGAVGALGYFGYSYIQNGDGGSTSNAPSAVVASDNSSEVNKGGIEGDSKSETDSISAQDREKIASKIVPAISGAVAGAVVAGGSALKASSKQDEVNGGVEHKAQPAVEKPTQDIVAHRGVDSESGAENSTISKQPAKVEESIKSEDRRELEAKQSKMVTEVIKRLKEKKEKDSAKALVQKPKAKRDKVAVTKKVKKREVVRRVPKLKRQTKTKYRVVTIRKGDTLASLAEKYYGNPMYYKPIIRANRDIRSSRSRLRIGQKVIIPTLDKSKKGRRLVRVRKGDTLASIAKRYYGNPNKYQKIIDANYKIKNKHTRLHIGQLIYVP